MYKSLREYIERLEREGELLRISTQVDTELEITEITDRISKCEGGGKALLFENTSTKFPVVTNIMGSERRITMALGIDRAEELTERIDALLREATSPKNTIWDKLRTLPLLADMSQWLPTTSNSRGECQEVILRGEKVDLSQLPILKCWSCDGGRFVTLPMVNTINPETGQRNVGMYRMQVLDRETTGMHWHIHKTGARHYESYRERGERMPVSVAIGGDPAYTYAATAPMPDNMDEYLLAGFLRRSNVKLVKCVTNDIYVPSDCDFVLEGYVDPAEEKIVEGPFGDHTGFYSLQDLYPKFHITAITHRRNAIYPATIVGVPPQEDAYIAIATERIFVSPIRFAMLPEVADMTMPDAGTAHNIAMVSIRRRYAGQSRKVIQSMWGAGQMMFNKYLVVADHHTNLRDNSQMAELLRRVDLTQSVVRSEGVYDVLDHATATNGYGGKLALDLTDILDCHTRQRTDHTLNYTIADGVEANEEWVAEWGVLVLYASPESDLQPIEVSGVNFVATFDSAAKNMSGYDLVWLAAANSDPRRDITITEGGTMVIDARSKRPDRDGNPARFPNVVTSTLETIELVDRRWSEYDIGDIVESPSRHYRDLLLSDREDWSIGEESK
ncbi:MAG: menaquinone biosynthesis decarboxylase [Rikenellaceae bacterium]